MNRHFILALAALLTALALAAPGAPRALPRWFATVAAETEPAPGNGACIDPDGNKIVPPPPYCPAITTGD